MTAPTLEPREVHVWRVRLDVPDAATSGARRSAARAALRSILAAYLDAEPASLSLSAHPGGKPRLEQGSGGKWLRFNLSHSGGEALVAVSRDREVGVDIERIAPERAISTIADQLFSPREAAVLRSLPSHRRVAAFFAWWTRKEALLKAMGTGLGIPLAEVEVRFSSVTGGGRRWSLRDLVVRPGYAAALAVEGDATPVRFVAA